MTIKEATAQTDEWRRYDIEEREPRRLRVDRPAKVTVQVNEMGLGRTDIDGIDVSNLVYGVEFVTNVGRATTVLLRMRGVSAEVEALGFVEIIDDGKAVRP